MQTDGVNNIIVTANAMKYARARVWKREQWQAMKRQESDIP